MIAEHIKKNYPNESCGLILKDDDMVIFLENISDNPAKSFKINPSELFPYLGQIKFIWHSHCVDSRRPTIYDARTPSLMDMEQQKLSGVPWLIYACDGSVVTDAIQIPRTPNNDYLNREFVWFVNDCYTLVQDYYHYELGIDLKEYVLHDYRDVRKSHAVFNDYINDYGFVELKNLDDLQNGDLFIVDNSGFTENHLVIYHDGKLLHQGMISCVEPFETYAGKFKKRLRYAG